MTTCADGRELKRRWREGRRSCTELEWRPNVLSGYVRKPSGVLTLTALSRSYHAVSLAALHVDSNPTNGAISLHTQLHEIKVHSKNPVWLRNYLYRTVVSKAFSRCRFIYFPSKTGGESGHAGLHMNLKKKTPSTRVDGEIRGEEMSISIPVTPVCSTAAPAICSPPAVRLNYTSPSGEPTDGSQQWSAQTYYHVHR